MIEFITEPFAHGFMQTALLASILTGLSCAGIGVYVVLRRMAFSGEALAHSVLPGLVVAYMTGYSLSVGALVAGGAAALGMGWLSGRERLREDSAIGVTFTAMFALGVLLASRSGSYRDLSHLLFGNLLGVTRADLLPMAIVTGVVLATLAYFHKELALTSYDESHAQAAGIRPGAMRQLLLLLLALAVVTGVQAVGVVLVSALLITPAAAASLLSRKLTSMMAYATLFAVLASVAGLYASYYADLVSGPAVVLACTAIFAVAAVGSAAYRSVRGARQARAGGARR